MNGQKFVYRFVSYPDILKGDVASRVEGGDLAPQAKKGESGLQEGEPAEHSRAGSSGSTKQSSRNDYIHSGLYTSFTLNSLQNGRQLFKSIKMENPGEKMADRRSSGGPAQSQEEQQQPPTLSSVIKFVNTPPKPAPAPTPQVEVEPPLMANPLDPRSEGLGGPSSLPSQHVYPFEQAQSEAAFSLQDLTSSNPSANMVLYSSQELVIDSDMESQPADPQTQEKVRARPEERQPSLELTVISGVEGAPNISFTCSYARWRAGALYTGDYGKPALLFHRGGFDYTFVELVVIDAAVKLHVPSEDSNSLQTPSLSPRWTAASLCPRTPAWWTLRPARPR